MALAFAEIYVITLPILSLLLLLPLFILLLKLFCFRNNEQQVRVQCWRKCIIVILFISSIAFNISALLMALNDLNMPTYTILVAMFRGTLYGDTYLVYILLISRVYYTFHGTMYQVKKCTLVSHMIIFLIVLGLNITFLVSTATVLTWVYYAWCILMMIGYGHLLYLFNYNLFQLVLSQRQTVVMEENNDTPKVSLNGRQLNLLSTIRKHTLLGTFMVFSNFLIFSFYILQISVASVIFIYCNQASMFIFVATSPICIYLGFMQSRKSYQRCCYLCDKKCRTVCHGLAMRRMNQLVINGDYIRSL